jgi:hypothetical protein
MPEPKTHAEQRPLVERVLQHIPGFKGYLQKSNRRESDALQRDYLASRLERAKRALDDYARNLVDTGHLDALPQCDRVRSKLDRLLGRIRGAMQGYSGVFDLVRIDEGVLDKVYEYEVSLLQQVDALAEGLEHLHAEVAALPSLGQLIDELERSWDHREDLLKGLE